MEMLLCGDDAVRPMLCGMSEPKNAGEVIALLQQAEVLTRDALAAGRRAGMAPAACARLDDLARVCRGVLVDAGAAALPDAGSAPVSPVFVEESKCDERLCCDEPSRPLELVGAPAAAAPAAAAPGATREVHTRGGVRRVSEAELRAAAHHTAALVAALACFAIVVLPALIVLLCSVFGLVIARCEGWQFALGFMYIAGNVTGLGEPLVDRSPSSRVGSLVDVLVSCWILIFAGAAVGATAEMRVIARLQDALPLEGARGAAVLLVVVPCCVLLAALAIAYVLATLEDWSVAVAFRYMVSAMCGLGNPLTRRSPASAAGRFVAIVCASWQMAIGGTIVGLAGAIPSLERALRALEGRFVAAADRIRARLAPAPDPDACSC